MSEHDAVTPLPGAPADPDAPVTTEAPWHNAPGTGAIAEPPVEEIVAYDKAKDGTLTAKVVEPPARPTRKSGRQAEAKVKGASAGPAIVDELAKPAEDS